MKTPRLSGLDSLRLSGMLMGVIIGFSALGPLLAARKETFTPNVKYLLDSAGFFDLVHSGWFIFVLILLGVNLVAAAVERLPGIWKAANQKIPPKVQVEQLARSKRGDRYVYIDLESTVAREEFRDLANQWSRSRVGKPFVLEDEGGLNELQIAAQKGRFNRVILYGAHFGLLLVALGFAIGALFGFEGRVTVDEGGRTDYVEITRGTARGWEPLMTGGQVMPGFFKPGFDLELTRFDVDYYPGTDRAKGFRSWVGFYNKAGKALLSRQLSVNRPIRFQGMSFHQVSYADTGRSGAVITVHDRKTDYETPIPKARRGGVYKIGHAEVRVLEIRDEIEDLGAAAQIEYVEMEGQEPETFWVFQKYPGFDEVHRKKSRYTFAVNAVEPRFSATLAFARDPGLPVVIAGAVLTALCLLLALAGSHDRYWFVWRPGRVTVVGWSSRALLFGPRFVEAMENFKSKLSRADKSVRTHKIEVRHA